MGKQQQSRWESTFGDLDYRVTKTTQISSDNVAALQVFQKQGPDRARPCHHWLIMVVVDFSYCLVAAMT